MGSVPFRPENPVPAITTYSFLCTAPLQSNFLKKFVMSFTQESGANGHGHGGRPPNLTLVALFI